MHFLDFDDNIVFLSESFFNLKKKRSTGSPLLSFSISSEEKHENIFLWF